MFLVYLGANKDVDVTYLLDIIEDYRQCHPTTKRKKAVIFVLVYTCACAVVCLV